MQLLRMLVLFGLVFWGGLQARAAVLAPDTLGGFSYYAVYSKVGIRSETQVSVEFNSDGTYSEHWIRDGSILSFQPFGIASDYAVPGEGTYTYTKQSDTQGLVTFALSSGSPVAWILVFSSATHGDIYTQAEGNGLTATRGVFTLQKLDPTTRPLANISTMLQVHSGETATIGFVVSNPGDYLIRIAGPALASFGVAKPWATPGFILYAGSVAQFLAIPAGGVVPTVYSLPWDSQPGLAATNSRAFLAVGAFGFPAGSRDVAAVTFLTPGVYTLAIGVAAPDPGGAALVEVYNYP